MIADVGSYWVVEMEMKAVEVGRTFCTAHPATWYEKSFVGGGRWLFLTYHLWMTMKTQSEVEIRS